MYVAVTNLSTISVVFDGISNSIATWSSAVVVVVVVRSSQSISSLPPPPVPTELRRNEGCCCCCVGLLFSVNSFVVDFVVVGVMALSIDIIELVLPYGTSNSQNWVLK